MQSQSKGASVWMNGWMNERWYDLLLKALIPSLFYHPLIFFRHGYPSLFLSPFFLGHASSACHLFFWGNHNLTLNFISGMF